jgi:hypothetical protein
MAGLKFNHVLKSKHDGSVALAVAFNLGVRVCPCDKREIAQR